MKFSIIKKNNGITLIVLIITIVVMLILAGVLTSFIDDNQDIEQQLQNQAEILNQTYNDINVIQDSIGSELGNDYNKITVDSEIENDSNLPNSITTEDWTGSVNKPRLLGDMTAIYFENGNEISLNNSSSQEEWNKWYDYSNKIWANAKTSDGSYWVWIPRFAYKITSNLYTGTSGNVSIVFVDNKNQNAGVTYSVNYPTVVDNAMTDYVVHPAFGTNLENGGNNKIISGFWIAKYEMSREDSPNGGETWAYTAGADVLTKNAGATSSIRAVSKPGVSSWSNISIGNAYSNSYYYNRNADSHMIKNSEWGAVAYLAQSAYGRDGVEITPNTSDTNITGAGGVLASTTGNESGVYDLSGGAWEYVAAYVLNAEGEIYRNEYASSFATATKSTPYITIYPTSEENTKTSNWEEYKKLSTSRFGDALIETSQGGDGMVAWNANICVYPSGQAVFFTKGGMYSEEGPGLFAFGRTAGMSNDKFTFRIILF